MKKIGLKIFRVFNEHQEIKLKPITVLTGPNNSGKSSFSKVFKLMSDGFITRNNIKEIDVLYFSEKLRNEIGDFNANVSRLSGKDYFEISFSFGHGSPKFESTVFLKYKKVSAVTFETRRVMKNNRTGIEIQDKNIEAYLQSIRIVINEHEIIKLTRNEDDKLPEADVLDQYESNSITDELMWKCDLDKKYASGLRNAVVEIKNNEINWISKVQNKSVYQEFKELVNSKKIHKYYAEEKNLLFPSLLSGIVCNFNNFFDSNDFADDYFKKIQEKLKSININSIDSFISGYRDFEEKFIYELYILFFNKFYFVYNQFDWSFLQIDDLHKILGREIKLDNTKIKEVDILKRIDNPLAEILIDEFLIKDKPEYKDLLNQVFGAKKINFLHPTIEAINKCIFMPYLGMTRGLKELKVEHYQQSSIFQNHYLRSNVLVANSLIYRFAEYFTQGLINEEVIAFQNKWLKKLNVGEEFVVESIKTEDEFFGYSFYLKKDGLKYSLHENGLGVQKILKIILEISMHKVSPVYDDKEVFFNLGGQHGTILLEEPESNLHPAFQSLLGEILVDAAVLFSLNFVIETHSEYLIRKLQYLTAKKKIKPEDSVIYYFHALDKIPKGEKQVKEIKIREDGMMDEDFGKGFFDESTRLTINLLNIQNKD